MTHARPRGKSKGRRSGSTEARIAEIYDLMRRLEWRTGKTGRELAAKWGLSEGTVKNLAAEASKRVRDELLRVKEATRISGVTFELVLADALDDDRPLARKNAIESAAELSRLALLLADRPLERKAARLRLRKLQAEAELAELHLRAARRAQGEDGADPAEGYEDPARVVAPAPPDSEAVGGGQGDL